MSSSTESIAQILQDYESVSPKSNNAEVRRDQVGKYYVSKCAGVTLNLSAKEAEGQNAALNEENTIQAKEEVEKETDDDDDYVVVEDAEEDDFVKI